MRVLLTGGSGFVGKHVSKYLKEKTDWEIVEPEVAELHVMPNMGKFDYIIHLASASSVEKSIRKPAEFIENNIITTLQVLEYARKRPPEVFLQMSTVEVYNITNPYAASKAAQEDAVTAYWKTYGLPVLILRSSNIIGEGQKNDKFVPKIIEKIKADEVVKIYTADGQIGSRKYVPVLNIADAILFLLDKYSTRDEVLYDGATDFPVHWDIEGDEAMDNLAMAATIARLLHKPLHYEYFEPEKLRPAYPVSLKAKGAHLQDFGWQPPQTLEEGLSWIK